MSRSVLLVAQYAPPSPLIAARRIGGLTKYLGRLGFWVTVLTSAMSGDGEVEGALRVVRTGDLLTSRLNWRRGNLDALRGDAAAAYSRRSRLEDVVVPDLGAVTWLPYALPAALRLNPLSFDCVLTSSPPQSAHLIGRALRRRGLPWIAELRDGWTFEPPRPPLPRPQRALDARLERGTLARADLVIAVTEPIAMDAARRLGVRAETVTNAFDPEEEATDPASVTDLVDASRFTLVHTGRTAVSGSTPRPLLEALELLGPGVLDVVLAGPLGEDERALVEAAAQRGLVRWVGALERARALALQRAADALLVVTEGSTRRSVATGKLFEYLAARRPILVLGEETEAARIVLEAGAGRATSASDPSAIADALRALVDDPPPAPEAAAVERYGFPAIAARVAELVEEVVSTSERSQTSTL